MLKFFTVIMGLLQVRRKHNESSVINHSRNQLPQDLTNQAH